MLIVEGIDGAGKTSFIKRLSEATGFAVHERASTSVGGPITNLFEWARKDVRSWNHRQPVQIYDRHPLISEYIYGPITRGWVGDEFFTPEAQAINDILRHRALVIWCDPGYDRVERNIAAAEQMRGVRDHTAELYWAYKSMVATRGLNQLVWDYRWEEVNNPFISQQYSFEHYVQSAKDHSVQWADNFKKMWNS